MTSMLATEVQWPAPPPVRAVITGRSGGVSPGAYAQLNLSLRCGDDPRAVQENRARLRRVLGLPRDPVWLQQVHGNRVVDLPSADDEPVADASVSRTAGVACVVLTADCLPVLFCADDGSVVAAAHAGWRGLAGGVIEATLAALRVDPARVLAWLGPAIGPDSFEVGTDVYRAFVDGDAGAAAAFRPLPMAGKFHADLFALARRRLRAAGVTRIFGGGVDTFSRGAQFFSFRRDRVTGRQAALVWLQ